MENLKPSLFVVPARQSLLAGGIDPSELIPGLLKRVQLRALLMALKVKSVPDAWEEFIRELYWLSFLESWDLCPAWIHISHIHTVQHAGKTEEENNGWVVFKLNTYLPFRREMKVVRGEALLGPSSFYNRSGRFLKTTWMIFLHLDYLLHAVL